MNYLHPTFSDLKDDLTGLQHFCRVKNSLAPIVRASFHLLKEQYERYSLFFHQPVPALKLGTHGSRGSLGLEGLYDSEAKCLVRLRPKALCDDCGVCPYCGLPGNLTFDHYLPRNAGAFPHLSVLSFNLVPACYACQNKKGAFHPQSRRHNSGRKGKGGTANARRVVHPYFDDFLLKRSVSIEWHLSPTGDPDRLEVRPLPHLRAEQRQLLEFHLGKLDLNARLQIPLRRIWRAAVEIAKGKTADALEAALEEAARGDVAQAGLPNAIGGLALLAIRRQPDVLQAVIAAAATPPPALVPTVMSSRRKARKFF